MDEPTKTQRTIWNLKSQAQQLESTRRVAYDQRLEEIITEYSAWDFKNDINKSRALRLMAKDVFILGQEFGANKMYEYI